MIKSCFSCLHRILGWHWN